MSVKPKNPPRDQFNHFEINEHLGSLGRAQVVDAKEGLIKDVKILGLTSSNKRDYSPAAVKRASKLYEGAMVNIDHIGKGQQRGLASRFGKYENVRYVEGEGLRGDLRFNPHHPMAGQVAWFAEHMPDALGNSHHANGKGVMKNGRMLVEEIEDVKSVDLVADPATTKSLFESAGDGPTKENAMDLKEVTLEQLQAQRPDLLEQIKSSAAQRGGGKPARLLEQRVRKLEQEKTLLEAERVVSAHKEAVKDRLRSSGLPKHAITEPFVEQLLEADDLVTVDRLIADRLAVARREDSRPRSSGKTLLEATGRKDGQSHEGDLKEEMRRAFGVSRKQKKA